jgi:phage/plasmid-associated DNA primase
MLEMSDRGRVQKTRPSCLSCRFLCRSKVYHSCKTKTLLLKVYEAKPPQCAAGLKGILMAGIEETNVTDTLDEGGVKKLTGTEVVTGRPLFKDFVTFNATMLVRHF